MRLTSVMAVLRMELDRTAAGWFSGQRGHQQQPGGQGQLGVVGRDAQARVEPIVKSSRQLGEVGLQAAAGHGVTRIGDRDVHLWPPAGAFHTATLVSDCEPSVV
ncbi:MAG TPA: hypothetical protein VG268_14945 [Streptosporangiaceae bacterium]|nr:hypothetical protein [Streptosporangiaceae bacterium]